MLEIGLKQVVSFEAPLTTQQTIFERDLNSLSAVLPTPSESGEDVFLALVKSSPLHRLKPQKRPLFELENLGTSVASETERLTHGR